MARAALGKGLDALFGESESQQQASVVEIPIVHIQPNPNQPRMVMNEDRIKELAETIKQNGLIQPIVVTKTFNPSCPYQLIAGERRWRACSLAGLDHIPALVKDIEPDDRLKLALIENIQREDLNPIELGLAYKTLLETHELTQETLAALIGKSRVAITNTIRLLKLPESIQDDIVNKKISEGHGRVLLQLESEEDQRMLADSIQHDGYSVRETERMVLNHMNGTQPLDVSLHGVPDDLAQLGIEPDSFDEIPPETPSKNVSDDSSDLSDLEEELSRFFGTKTKIQHKGNRGRVIIEYHSLEDIDRILELIRNN
jgi:ParB family transcriptional regulator, chromosome partitioning protein